jgi:drug/metabolite transporter (DMT)-like permease
VALEELAVGHLVLWRFAIAAAVLVPLPARRGLPYRRDLPRFALSGLICVPITFLPQFEGLTRTTVASASLLVGTGDTLVFLSMVTTTAWVLVMVPLVRRYGGLASTAWTVALGGILQIPVAWLDGVPSTPDSLLGWGALLGLGLGCTAGSYALWNLGLERVPPSRAGIYLNLEPVVGAGLGVALLHEPVTTGLLAGGGLVLAASLLASFPARPPVAVPRTSLPRAERPSVPRARAA